MSILYASQLVYISSYIYPYTGDPHPPPPPPPPKIKTYLRLKDGSVTVMSKFKFVSYT